MNAPAATLDLDDGAGVVDILKPPEPDASEDIQDLVNSAGVEVIAVDWVFQKIAGQSLVEAVIKPITGDFTKIAANAEAWRTIAEAMTALSGTMSANANALGERWKGDAAFAHETYVDIGWSAGLLAEAGIANAIAKGFDTLADYSKQLAAKALELLKKLIDKLIVIAAKACIPVAGWAAEATTIIDALDIFSMILEIIEMIKDIISKVGDLWNSIKDVGSQLAKIKDIQNVCDLASVVTNVVGGVMDIKDDVIAIKDDVTGIKDKAKEIGTTASEARSKKEDSESANDDSTKDSNHEHDDSGNRKHADEKPETKPAEPDPEPRKPEDHRQTEPKPEDRTPPPRHDDTPHHKPSRPRSGRISGRL